MQQWMKRCHCAGTFCPWPLPVCLRHPVALPGKRIGRQAYPPGPDIAVKPFPIHLETLCPQIGDLVQLSGLKPLPDNLMERFIRLEQAYKIIMLPGSTLPAVGQQGQTNGHQNGIADAGLPDDPSQSPEDQRATEHGHRSAPVGVSPTLLQFEMGGGHHAT